MKPMGSKTEQASHDIIAELYGKREKDLEPNGYLAFPEERYAVSCLGCGKIEHLVMIPLKHDDGAIVGWAFVCPDCRESIQGAPFRLDKQMVCPECLEAAIRTHYQNEEGDWFVCWLCGCKPDPEQIAEAERIAAQDKIVGEDGNDDSIGWYQKYSVVKRTGQTDPNAVYFVLRLDTDVSARHAALMYADHCRPRNPRLAEDIVQLVLQLTPRTYK